LKTSKKFTCKTKLTIMKNLSKISALILLVAVAGLSSCVKTEVSPEVTALRQAQVDKLKAQIDGILADNSYQKAQTRQLSMQIRYDSLVNAFNLKQTEAEYTVTLAQIQRELENEKANLAEAQLNTAQAVAEYNRFITVGRLAQNTIDLLGKYNNESRVLQQLYNDRAVLTEQIAEGQLLLASGQNVSWDFVKAQLQTQLDAANSQLTAMNAALPLLVAALADPAALQTKIIALHVSIADYTDQLDALETKRLEAYNTWQAAAALVTHAQFVINIMDNWDPLYGSGYLNDSKDVNASLATVNDNIVAATATLTAYNNTLALRNADLTSKTATLTAANTAYGAKLALYNTALTNDNNAQNDVAAKLVLWQIAQNNLAADPANAALIAAETAAHTAYTNAVTAQGLTATALTKANAALSLADGTRTTAQSDYDSAKSAAAGAQANVDSEVATIAGYNNDKAGYTNDLAIIAAKVAEWQTDYTSSKANILTLISNSDLLSKKHILIAIDKMKMSDLISQMNSVLSSLETNYDNVTTDINNLKSEIADQQATIADLTTQISQNGIDKKFAQDQVTKLQALLATTNIKIAESEALVAKWKKLLDDAIAAG
jgi:chromosome segregation ATPase